MPYFVSISSLENWPVTSAIGQIIFFRRGTQGYRTAAQRTTHLAKLHPKLFYFFSSDRRPRILQIRSGADRKVLVLIQ